MALKFYESPFHAVETPEEASKSVLKTDIMILIRDIIALNGWSQKKAAKVLGVDQPRVSDIVNGKIEKFTLDALFCMLDLLGFRAKFTYGSIEESSITIKRSEEFGTQSRLGATA